MIADEDRNWQTRQKAEQARKAAEDLRHARNAEAIAFCVDVFGRLLILAVFVAGLYAVVRAGLFAWLEF